MSLQERILDDIKTAMKAKEAERLSVLRMAKAALMNKKIDKGDELTDEEVAYALQTLVNQRKDAAEQYEIGGRPEQAEKEKAEILVLEEYLPRAATEEEMERAVSEAITETGANSMRDIGSVMKTSLAKLTGKMVDRKQVNELIKSKLQ